jgi:hypothetical protein
MPSRAVQDLTIRDLAGRMRRLDSLSADSKEYANLNELMAMASLCLEDSGALARLLWWAPELRPDAPPDAGAKLFVMGRAKFFEVESINGESAPLLCVQSLSGELVQKRPGTPEPLYGRRLYEPIFSWVKRLVTCRATSSSIATHGIWFPMSEQTLWASCPE